MNHRLVKSSMEEIRSLMNEYLKTLHCVGEDFWEYHIRMAEFYKIELSGRSIGYFGIYRQERLLTQFYIREEYWNLAQPVFGEIIEGYGVDAAYVLTGDELFLSLCIDHHIRIEKQAYLFDGTIKNEVRPPEYPRSCLFPVKPEEFDEVIEKTGDFFEPISRTLLETGENILYKLCVENEILGYGIIVPNVLLIGYGPCGMITLEKNRRKGIGRSIQLHLADICRENGLIPVSGCWYYNHLSKKTIESAGRYTKTRILKVIFREKEAAKEVVS